MRGPRSIKVFVLVFSVRFAGVALYATSPRAFKASVSATGDWQQLENVPTGRQFEDFLALVPTDDGALVVGTGGTKMDVRTDDTFVDDVSGTTKDLFSAHRLGSWRVVSGIDIVAMNKYDGGGWFDLVDTDGSGDYYTPVLLTTDRVFFGWPGTTAFAFDYLCYQMLDGDFGMCRMVSGGPIMALTEVASGIRGLTKAGDILEWPLDLTSETVVFDQPNDQGLDIGNARFSGFDAARVHALNYEGTGSYEYCRHPGTPGGTWTRYSIPYTMDAYGFAIEPGQYPHQFITVFGSNTGTQGMIVSTSDGGDIWQQEPTGLPPAADYPLAAAAVIADVYGGPSVLMAVGDSSTVLAKQLNSLVYHDGFESGGLAYWSYGPPPQATPTLPPPTPWPTPTPTPTK